MKTLKEIKKECIGDVFTIDEFAKEVNSGFINGYDGIGYFHDGENETNIEVFSNFNWEDVENYPYVCWYNK